MTIDQAAAIGSRMDQLQWSLASRGTNPKYAYRSATVLVRDLDDWLAGKWGHASTEPSRHLIATNRNSIAELVLSFDHYIGSGKLAGFMYSDELPLDFARSDANELAFVLKGMASDQIYNRLRLTARQRAARAMGSILLPLLEHFYLFNKNLDIKDIVLIVTYGSKDFSQEEARPDPEVLALISPIEAVTAHFKGKLTEDALLAVSEVYLGDQDSSPRKIKLVSE